MKSLHRKPSQGGSLGGKPEQLPPTELLAAQAWFGKAIARKLDEDWKSQTLGMIGPSLASEAESHLRSNDLIGALDRLQIYNRQYWFRLITVMQVDWICTLHVMGLKRYNDWAIRYLEAYPPATPYLNDLDQQFIAFMQSAYDAEDRDWVLEAMAYDRAFAKAFEGGQGQVLVPESFHGLDLMQVQVKLAPHVTALNLNHDWSGYRALILDDESLERQVALPEPRPFHRVIHRHANTLFEKEVEPGAARLLAAMEAPGTLPEIFDRLPELSDEDTHQLETHLTEWFTDFVARGWVVSGDKK